MVAPVNPLDQQFHTTAYRRANLPQQVKAIGDFLIQSPSSDELTVGLRHWFDLFSRAFSHSERRSEVFALLDGILRDRAGASLDETSSLCRDGRTYSAQFLAQWESTPSETRGQLPYDPSDPVAHPVLPQFLRLIRDISIPETPQPPTPPSVAPVVDLAARAKRIAEQRLRRSAENPRIATLTQTITRVVNEDLERHRRTIHLPMAHQLETFGQTTDVAIRALEERVNVLFQRVTELLGRHQEGVRELREENERLREEIDRISFQISELKKADKQLEADIQACKVAIEEKKSAWVKELLTAVAIVGACWFASWALEGTGAAITPTQGGGATTRFRLITF